MLIDKLKKKLEKTVLLLLNKSKNYLYCQDSQHKVKLRAVSAAAKIILCSHMHLEARPAFPISIFNIVRHEEKEYVLSRRMRVHSEIFLFCSLFSIAFVDSDSKVVLDRL